MSLPFSDALSMAFTFSFIACLIAAAASWMRGGKYHYREEDAIEPARGPAPGSGPRRSDPSPRVAPR
jgi:hypothetical protein